jgi:cytochrome P450
MRDALDVSDRYFQALVASRRHHPGEDMLSALIEAEFEGEPITDDELIGNVVLLFGAAYETTANLIGNGLIALLQNPGQLELLRAEPALMANAVEELLRYDSPAQLHGRWTQHDLKIDDTVIPADSRLIMLIGSANRDPAQFPDPDSLDLRRPNIHPASFGGGVHHCLGAGMARLEAKIAFSRLLERFPRIRLADEPLQWRSDYVAVRGLAALRVELGAG